jgi:hypothetical protein
LDLVEVIGLGRDDDQGPQVLQCFCMVHVCLPGGNQPEPLATDKIPAARLVPFLSGELFRVVSREQILSLVLIHSQGDSQFVCLRADGTHWPANLGCDLGCRVFLRHVQQLLYLFPFQGCRFRAMTIAAPDKCRPNPQNRDF